MPILQKLLKFINSARVKYELIEHRTVYTAYDKAATLKVPPKIIGKTLVLKRDKNLVIALIPANKKLNLQKLKKITKSKKLELVSEKLIKNRLKGVKVGAVPPFGSLWGISTFFDRNLMKEKEIILNGGDYNSSIKMKPKYFKNLIPDLIIESFAKKK